MIARSLSSRTRLFSAFVLLGVAVVYALIVLGVGGESGVTATADIGEALIVTVAAAVVFRAALGFRQGEPLRRNWMLIGTGVALFAIGDVVWAYYEVVLGAEVPFPGLPDVFYVLEYPFAAAGMIGAALAFRKIMDVRREAWAAAALAAVGVVAVWALLLRMIVSDSSVSAAERALSGWYPTADILLGFAPALFIILVVRRLGGGAIAWPWRAVAAGFAVIALTDTAFAYLDWNGLYASGNIIDIGWMLGYSLVGVGASIARDVHAPSGRR